MIWLVVWNMTFIFPSTWNSHPNWLMFFRGVETTNQKRTDGWFEWIFMSFNDSFNVGLCWREKAPFYYWGSSRQFGHWELFPYAKNMWDDRRLAQLKTLRVALINSQTSGIVGTYWKIEQLGWKMLAQLSFRISLGTSPSSQPFRSAMYIV